MKPKLYSAYLSLNELLLMDGKASADIQKTIDLAKKENAYGFALPVMNEIIRKAEEKGELTWTHRQISSCDYCDKKRRYYELRRTSRKGRKGSPDYDAPNYYSGIEFHPGFVHFIGSGDMCSDCAKEYRVVESLIDYILEHDLKIQIKKNEYKESRYIKDDIKVCFQCKKEMQESKMGRRDTLFGNGTYSAKCPHCGAEAMLFGQSHLYTDKFVMIRKA